MIASYIIIFVFFVFSLIFSKKVGLNLGREINIAGVRSVVQMFLMGITLEYIFRLHSVWHVLYFAAFMSIFAAYTARDRIKSDCKCIKNGFLSIYLPSMAGLLPVIFSGAVPVTMSAVLPVAGMVVGNCMNAYSISVDRLHAETKANLPVIQGILALGLPMDTAVKESLNNSIRAGIKPVLNNIASLGVVLLPGLSAGLIMAGMAPLKAVVYQLVVMYMIFGVNMMTSYIACRLYALEMVRTAATEVSA